MGASTEFFQSQVGGRSVMNYSYTDFPVKLFVRDIYYFFVYSWALPWIVRPLTPWPSGPLDELYPSWENIACILVHFILVMLQLVFVFSLPVAVILPPWVSAAGLSALLAVNWVLCKALNSKETTFHSDEQYAKPRPEHAHEQWVFLNGVAVGEHWMKSNLNRLAITFGRPVLGIHNKTSGIIFDIVECLVQRNFTYATNDVRICFKLLRDVLYDPSKSKVIFILHSQGGIEGSLVLDWLLQEMPQDLLAKLEVYTFGNAANHFNNPHRHVDSQRLTMHDPRSAATTFYSEASSSSTGPGDAENGTTAPAILRPTTTPAPAVTDSTQPPPPPPSPARIASAAKDRVIGHIEHYAHSTDFVALWGVLHFATHRVGSPQLPRFLGRLFNRTSSRGGHQLNQHYLDDMFPLARDPATGAFIGADENNEFMEETVEVGGDGEEASRAREDLSISCFGTDVGGAGDGVPPPVQVYGMAGRRRGKAAGGVKVKELSRLWSYRNGRSPGDVTGPRA